MRDDSPIGSSHFFQVYSETYAWDKCDEPEERVDALLVSHHKTGSTYRVRAPGAQLGAIQVRMVYLQGHSSDVQIECDAIPIHLDCPKTGVIQL